MTIESGPEAQDKVFDFVITVNGSAVDVQPAAAQPGLYTHGHARIKKRGSGRRIIQWTHGGPFTLKFAALASDAASDPNGSGPISASIPDAALPVGNSYVFPICLLGGSGSETVVYKYDLLIGGEVVLDPVVIVDR